MPKAQNAELIDRYFTSTSIVTEVAYQNVPGRPLWVESSPVRFAPEAGIRRPGRSTFGFSPVAEAVGEAD
jgi:hypothetical protein